MRKTQTRALAFGAIMTALTAILAQIQVPLPTSPVPISLATLGVFLSGALLGAKYGLFSMLAYVLLGAMGVPVFAGFSGGLQVLAGPTGGYIAGYILGAWLCGLVAGRGRAGVLRLILAMLAAEVAILVLGTAYFMIATQNTLTQSLWLCVIPFLPGDAAKLALATLLALALNRRAGLTLV